jgi:hypothetical protein
MKKSEKSLEEHNVQDSETKEIITKQSLSNNENEMTEHLEDVNEEQNKEDSQEDTEETSSRNKYVSLYIDNDSDDEEEDTEKKTLIEVSMHLCILMKMMNRRVFK